MRVLLHFTKRIFLVDLFASLLAVLFFRVVAATAYSEPFAVAGAVRDVAMVGLTVGFALAVYMYFLLRRHELPLYHNHGLRVRVCIGYAYAFHVLVFLPLFVVGYAIHVPG